MMLVKFIESENEAYWLLLRDVALPADEKQETMTVRRPKDNRLSSINWESIYHYVKDVTDTKLAAARARTQQAQRQAPDVDVRRDS